MAFVKATGFPDPSYPSNMKSRQGEDPDVEKGPYITVAIPEHEIYGDANVTAEADPSISGTKRRPSWFKRHLDPKRNIDGHKTVPVRMLKSDFVKYFFKDQRTGRYRDGVVEPPGGRKQFLQQCIFDFESGQMDDEAYEGNRPDDYMEFKRWKSSVSKAFGDVADLMGQPYTPWVGKAIR